MPTVSLAECITLDNLLYPKNKKISFSKHIKVKQIDGSHLPFSKSGIKSLYVLNVYHPYFNFGVIVFSDYTP
jgi:hypothetical protein